MPKKFRAKFAGNGAENTGKLVNSPSGNGLLNKTPKRDNIVPSVSDSDMADMGFLRNLGDDLVETDAMCDVDEDGVENKPQGVKKPGNGKPEDGYYSKVGHNHKKSIAESKNKNTGSLTMEQLFESYVDENDVVDHEGFADYSTQNDYEVPSEEDTVDLMKANQSFIFTPTSDGKYTKTEVSTSGNDMGGSIDGVGVDDVGMDDLPEMPSTQTLGVGDSDISTDDMPTDDIDMSPTSTMSYGGDDEEFDDEEFDDEDEDYDGEDYDGEEFDDDDEAIEDDYVEESLTTASIADVPSMVPKTRKKKVQKAGNPNKAVKGMKNHGETLKRKLKNDDVSESFKLPVSIAKNVSAIVEHVDKQFAKIPSFKKYNKIYNVVVENDGKYFETKSTRSITEAATDAEEISVIGKGNTTIKVKLFEGKKNVGMFLVDMPKLNNRKPQILKEGVIFRFPSIAKRISEQYIGENIVHTIKRHPYGVIIKGDIDAIFESFGNDFK